MIHFQLQNITDNWFFVNIYKETKGILAAAETYKDGGFMSLG